MDEERGAERATNNSYPALVPHSSVTRSRVPLFILSAVIVLLLGGAGVGAYFSYEAYSDLEAAYEETLQEVSSLEREVADQDEEINLLTEANQNLTEEVEERDRIIDRLVGALEGRRDEIEAIRREQAVDPELLKKYSRVYFLNENYEPRSLIDIPEEYIALEDDEERFLEKAWPFLEDMLEEARDDGLGLTIISGYRSFDDQGELHDRYTTIYGEGANRFSATQGYSEHQLGTAVDFSTGELDGALRGFEDTPEYEWLLENAHRFGFVLSYPEDNPSFIFEPWHWRFVGVELATDLYVEDKYFYDMDQRRIDEYRAMFFDR